MGIISTPYAETSEFFTDFLFNEELLIYSSAQGLTDHSHQYISPEKINLDKIWLLEEGNCLRLHSESICHLQENIAKPKNLEYSGSSISTLIKIVDKVGGLTIIPELATQQLTEEQQKNIFHFKKPSPVREISLIYYKPSYKQKLFDELANYLRKTLSDKLNYNKNPKDFSVIKP